MAIKQALGLAVSGTEVRLAHLSNHNGQIRIEGLERARLRTTLENKPDATAEDKSEDTETNDDFGARDASQEKNIGSPAPPASNDSGNLEVLYRLLEKYTKKKTKIAFNVPLSMVKYQRPEMAAAERADEANKDAESSWAAEVITAHDGGRLLMSYEKSPPTMLLLRDANEFLHGHLYLTLMESTEVALANLARRSEDLEASKVTAIIYIEDDFTRLIFMRGKDLLHVSSIIHENTASPDILEVIYRKLLYEQDEAQIPEVAAILLAGKSNRLKAKEFFVSHLEAARVNYLAAPAVTGLSANDMQRGVFAEFAVPIALAWKTLEPKNPFFIPTNLLPQDVLDQQQILKLNYHGYILLTLTGLAAFFLTWQIIQLNNNIREMRKKNTQLEKQIANNQETVDRVLQLDNQCQRLKKNLSLSDSLAQGHDEFLAFLQKLNSSVGRVGNLWVDEIVTSAKGFSVRGSSLSREAIPLLAERLERASLSQVTRVESPQRKVFGFSLERQSAPDTAKIADQGLSSIDAARYASNGNLILSKDGVRPASAAALDGLAGSPPATMMPSASPASLPANVNGAKTEQNDREVAPRNEAPPPIVRPTAATNNAIVPNKNSSTVAASSTSTTRQPVSRESAALLKPDDQAPKLGNGVMNSDANGARNSVVAEKAKSTTVTPPSPPAQNGLTNGAASRAVEEGITSSTRKEQLSIVETSSPAASRPALSKPAEAPPEIYRGYTIEAATSYTKELAEQYAAAYRKQGHNAAVENYPDERTGTRKYRVLIGAFATRPAAEKQAAQIAGLLMKDYRVVGIK